MLRQGTRVIDDSRRLRIVSSTRAAKEGVRAGTPKKHSTDGTLADKAGLSGLEALDETLDYYCRPQDQCQS